MEEVTSLLAIEKKAKRTAWITGFFLPSLYVLASGYQIGHAGLGGIVMLVVFYIPLIPISAIALRFMLTPIYRTMLDKNAKPLLRKAMVGILAVLAVAFSCLLIKTIFFPYDAVNEAIKEIPHMQAYFNENKEELERQRLQSDGGDKHFSVMYPFGSGLHITFNFAAQGSESTGYKGPACYTYTLDDYWYIEIYLMPAY